MIKDGTYLVSSFATWDRRKLRKALIDHCATNEDYTRDVQGPCSDRTIEGFLEDMQYDESTGLYQKMVFVKNGRVSVRHDD